MVAAFPIQWIGSQPQMLLSGGPEVRRSFLDMAMFHVEPSSLKLIQDYQRALRQRNAAVRSGRADDVIVWNAPLAAAGEALTSARTLLVQRLAAVMVSPLEEAWFPRKWGSLVYRQGWDRDEALLAALDARLEQDIQCGFTTLGPHRADLEFNAGRRKAEKIFSRGEQKSLVLALHFGLSDLIKASGCQETPVVLIDDLGAELDRKQRERVLYSLAARKLQAFITSLEPLGLPLGSDDQIMFHVEHGRVHQHTPTLNTQTGEHD